MDLVEISPNAEPPVCKVVDYKKFLYDQKKKQKELKAKAAKTVIKEIRFGPQTDEHDFNLILFKEQGEILLLRFVNELEDYGKAEQLPLLEGKKMIMVIAPKKTK
ncbi:MAG: translation initiation factor [Bacteroidetes bacterium]|nr:translation initiation factor [Bacteroidota bacterium]